MYSFAGGIHSRCGIGSASRQHVPQRLSPFTCQSNAGVGPTSTPAGGAPNTPIGAPRVVTGQSEQAHATASASVIEPGAASQRRVRRQRLEAVMPAPPVAQKPSEGMPLASIFGVGLVAAASILFVLYRQYFTNSAKSAVAGVAGLPGAISQVGGGFGVGEGGNALQLVIKQA